MTATSSSSACRDELGDWRVCVLTPFGSRIHAPWAMAATGEDPRRRRPGCRDHVERRRLRPALSRDRRAPDARILLLDPKRRWTSCCASSDRPRSSPPSFARAHPARCCCRAAAPRAARRSGSSASAPTTCWPSPRATLRFPSCWRPIASACATSSTCPR
jgi:hypothetical protein